MGSRGLTACKPLAVRKLLSVGNIIGNIMADFEGAPRIRLAIAGMI